MRISVSILPKGAVCLLALTAVFFVAACSSTTPLSTNTNPNLQGPFSIGPLTATVFTGATQQFSTSGIGTAGVSWSVNGVIGGSAANGTIDGTGLYTAPAVPPSPNTVTISATSGGVSATAPASVQVLSPQPQATSLAPAALTAGNGDTVVSISGTGFNPLTVASANGTALATTLVSSTEISAVLPAALASSAGMLNISVATPAPGGGNAGPLFLTVVKQGVVAATIHPLVASYTLDTPRDASVRIDFGLDTTYAQHTWFQPTPPGGGPVTILVAGMRGATQYHLRAVANFPDGSQYVGPDQTFTTGDISGLKFPTATVTTTGISQPSSGVESLESVPLSLTDTTNNIVIMDLQGNVIWYYTVPAGLFAFPIKLLPNGHLILTLSDTHLDFSCLREIDLAGNTIRSLSQAQLQQELFDNGATIPDYGAHHDFAVLPNGHVVLVTNLTETVNRPDCGTVNLQADYLVDLDESWTPTWTWNTFDWLNNNRYPLTPCTGIDWTHGNALVYTPDDGNLIFSMRNQSWVIKINYANGTGNGQVLWTSGYGGNMTIASGEPAQWHYGQHYPFILGPVSAGVFTMGIWDDGNNRVLDNSGTLCGQPAAGSTPATPACYSRAVIYSVDETSKTMTELWEDNVSPDFTPFLGSIQQLPNGNIEFDEGVITIFPPLAKVREVTYTTPPQQVWEMDVNHLLYRAVRWPSLYPGVQW